MQILNRLYYERDFTGEQLIRQYADSPEIDAFAVLTLFYLLGCKIQRSTTQSFSHLVHRVKYSFSPSKICKFSCVPHGQQDVFRLDVSMHYFVAMQILNSHAQLFYIAEFSAIYGLIVSVGLEVLYQTVQLPI